MSQNSECTVSSSIWTPRKSLARLANKWSAMVVVVLGRDGVRRFGELRTAVDGVSAKVLTETLRDLERDGLIARHAYAEVPPRVVYELTELGCTLHAPMRELSAWAEQHAAEVLAAREAYDAARGAKPSSKDCPEPEPEIGDEVRDARHAGSLVTLR